MQNEFPDKRIADFIKKHHVLTISTAINNESWSANCFYSYITKSNTFIFSSDSKTKHGINFQINKNVSGSIVLETKIPGKIKGVQFLGEVSQIKKDEKELRKSYFMQFPYAKALNPELWKVEPTFLKLTDNNLGFGKKLIWEKNNKK